MKTPITFTASDTSILQGCTYQPSRPTQGTVLFMVGWSGHYKDYDSILAPLSESYNVFAFNTRDHGESQGRFTKENCTRDVIELCIHYRNKKTALMGHSISSIFMIEAASIARSVILMNPYLGKETLNPVLGTTLSLLSSQNKATAVTDTLLGKIVPTVGKLHVRHPLSTAGTIYTIATEQRIAQPILTFIANKDMTYGTNNQKRYARIVERCKELSLVVEDASELVQGLNHCFNYRGLSPFMKPEKGKNTTQIIERMYDFLGRTL